MAQTAEARIETHEQVCAIRYISIDHRIGRLEKLAYITVAGIITQLLGICGYLIHWVLTHLA